MCIAPQLCSHTTLKSVGSCRRRAAYQWDVRTHQRVADTELVDKSRNFQCCTAAEGSHGVIVRDASGCISLLVSGQLQPIVDGPEGFDVPFCLLGSGWLLVVGTQEGHLLVWPCLKTKTIPTQQAAGRPSTGMIVPAHASRVRQLCSCCEGDVLLSAAEDGSVMSWNVRVRSEERDECNCAQFAGKLCSFARCSSMNVSPSSPEFSDLQQHTGGSACRPS
jgi:WD40 repeat protein